MFGNTFSRLASHVNIVRTQIPYPIKILCRDFAIFVETFSFFFLRHNGIIYQFRPTLPHYRFIFPLHCFHNRSISHKIIYPACPRFLLKPSTEPLFRSFIVPFLSSHWRQKLEKMFASYQIPFTFLFIFQTSSHIVLRIGSRLRSYCVLFFIYYYLAML